MKKKAAIQKIFYGQFPKLVSRQDCRQRLEPEAAVTLDDFGVGLSVGVQQRKPVMGF